MHKPNVSILCIFILAWVFESVYTIYEVIILEEKKGNAATRAKNRYNAKAYDRLYPYVKKGKKAVYLKAAIAQGISLNEFIEKACDQLAGLEYEQYEGWRTVDVKTGELAPAPDFKLDK